MAEGIHNFTTKTKTKYVDLRILAALNTLCIYPDNDHDPDFDKYLNRLISIYTAFHPPNTDRTCAFYKNYLLNI